jgi:drug/metabolite transporter (DMT)-like permease
MKVTTYVLALSGVACASIGQVMFKLGAQGRHTALEFLNPWIGLGLLLYGIGTVLWIVSLSEAPLTSIYPFTALTFVIVYGLGIGLLGEAVSRQALLGVGLVLLGLFLVARA